MSRRAAAGGGVASSASLADGRRDHLQRLRCRAGVWRVALPEAGNKEVFVIIMITRRPLILLDCETPEGRSYWRPFKDLFDGAVPGGVEKRQRESFFSITSDPEKAVSACEADI